MDWSDLFSRLAESPAAEWGEQKPLQARKLAACVDAKARAAGLSHAAVIAMIVDRARDRAGPPALFLVNCGSSGSHWIESMLASLPDIHACGEVYVPPSLHEPLSGLGEHARACFLDALHLLHAEDPVNGVGDSDMLINSAHSWNPYDLAGPSSCVVLLVRDPVDIVLSRTFRKQKLRRHIAPGVTDMDYLERNRDYVVRFMASALRRRPRHMIRYEEARTDPVGVVATVMNAVGHPFDVAVAGHRIMTLLDGDRASAVGVRGNLYRGPAVEVPDEVIASLAEDLAPLRRQLGYPTR